MSDHTAQISRNSISCSHTKATTAPDSTDRLLSVYEEHLADEYADVKMLGIFTVAGDSWIATSDVSTPDGLAGSKIVS